MEEITTLVYLCDVYFHIFSRGTQLVITFSLFTFGNIAIFVNSRLDIERDNDARTHTSYSSTYNVETVFTISSVKTELTKVLQTYIHSSIDAYIEPLFIHDETF